jgi:hypothetical protein
VDAQRTQYIDPHSLARVHLPDRPGLAGVLGGVAESGRIVAGQVEGRGHRVDHASLRSVRSSLFEVADRGKANASAVGQLPLT